MSGAVSIASRLNGVTSNTLSAQSQHFFPDWDIENQNPGVLRFYRFAHAQPQAQIDDWNAMSSHISETQQVVRPIWNFESFLMV